MIAKILILNVLKTLININTLNWLFLAVLLAWGNNSHAQKTKVYLFPGQGSDERLFSEIRLDSSFEICHIKYPIPDKKSNMHTFAMSIISQIDTNGNYVFIGVSLGGMIISELCDTLNPQKAIIISSAKYRKELPFRYKFQKAVPLYKIVPKGLIKGGARMLQPIVEPDRKKNKATFKSMLKSKDKTYMKRSVGLIVNWDKKNYSDKIIHVHGTKDHTLPYRNIKCNYTVSKGSHMMALTKGNEINELLMKILKINESQ